ncbi:hydrogenase maturation nickel metallochaperone HypA [Bacteroidota bacterium]
MHELSLAYQLVEMASDAARRENSRQISQLNIEVGKLSGVMIDALTTALTAIKENSPARNAKINIIEIEVVAVCEECGTEFNPESFYTECPECKSYKFKITKGRELNLKSIIVE